MIGNRQFSQSLVLLAVWLGAQSAHAQIDRPRSHVHYGVELEPHLVVQWDHGPGYWASDGIGVGLRASIPVMQDGPVTTLNNSLAMSFGLDWAHFGDNNCYGPGPRAGPYYTCSANDFWIPIVVQWNFFFSDLISAFPEVGLAIEHTRFDGNFCQQGNNVVFCGSPSSNTSAELVLWLGVRFHLSKSFALTLRLGTPSLTLGASFLL
jgi:hypothetical protein